VPRLWRGTPACVSDCGGKRGVGEMPPQSPPLSEKNPPQAEKFVKYLKNCYN